MKISWFLPYNSPNIRIYSQFKRFFGVNPYILTKNKSIIGILRCLQIIPYLEKMGIRCTINNFNEKADIAVIVRWQNEKAYELLKRQKDRGAKVVFDLNVNYFDTAGMFPGNYGVIEKHVREVKQMTSEADVVTCASEYIRNRASDYNSNTEYIPDSVNLKHFRFQKNKQDFEKSVLNAIWSGQPKKSQEVVDIHSRLTARGIPLIIISEKKPVMHSDYTFVPWSYHSFPKTILKGDFCIAPRRTDNTYNLGHSNYKIGVFMAQGVPALAAPLPSYKEVIGKTGGGKICESNLEWDKALDEVLENRKMLWEWSKAAYDGMKEYSTESVARKYVKFFEELLSN